MASLFVYRTTGKRVCNIHFPYTQGLDERLMKLSKVQKQRAIEQMHDLMLRLPLAEEADRIEQCWTAAEDTVDSYITAAEARASDLPPSEQLGRPVST